MHSIGKGMWWDVNWQNQLFLSILESDKEGLEKQQETRYNGKLLACPPLVSHHLGYMPGLRCRKTNDRISLEVYKNLSIKQICSALPRCNLAGKALKRISQCHLVVGWLQGKPCLTWKGWKLPLEISKLHVCLGEYRLCPCVSIRVNFWERGQVGLHSLLAGSDSIRKVRSYWRGELSWNLNRLLCYYSPIKPCYLKYDLRTRQQWHHLETVRNVGSPSHTCWIRICFSQGPQEAHSRLRNFPLCYLGHQWPAHGSNLVEIRDFWNSVSLPSCYRTANILPCPNPRN